MCDLCNEGYITNSGFFRPTEEKKDYIFHDEDGYFLNVYCDCGDYTATPIHYCPMCGRGLDVKEDEEHMSASENRAYWGIFG